MKTLEDVVGSGVLLNSISSNAYAGPWLQALTEYGRVYLSKNYSLEEGKATEERKVGQPRRNKREIVRHYLCQRLKYTWRRIEGGPEAMTQAERILFTRPAKLNRNS